MNNNQRTIISAMNPCVVRDVYTEVFMYVWFEEFDGHVPFCASPFDCEGHGRELWFRAMKGEYGPVDIVSEPPAAFMMPARSASPMIEINPRPQISWSGANGD